MNFAKVLVQYQSPTRHSEGVLLFQEDEQVLGRCIKKIKPQNYKAKTDKEVGDTQMTTLHSNNRWNSSFSNMRKSTQIMRQRQSITKHNNAPKTASTDVSRSYPSQMHEVQQHVDDLTLWQELCNDSKISKIILMIMLIVFLLIVLVVLISFRLSYYKMEHRNCLEALKQHKMN